MAIPALALAGIAAGTQIAGSGVNAAFQAKSNKKSREFSKEMYNLNVADNRYNWDMENAYNHPSQQMARLKEAGLNPALLYGGGPGNMSAGSVTAASPKTSYATPPQLDLGAISASGQTMIQTARLKNETALTQADIDVKKISRLNYLQKLRQLLSTTRPGMKLITAVLPYSTIKPRTNMSKATWHGHATKLQS